MPLPRLVVSIPTASSDGKFYGRWPNGNAPVGPGALAGALQDDSSGSGTLSGVAIEYNSAVIGKLPDFYISPSVAIGAGAGTQADPWGIDALGYNDSAGTYHAGQSATYAGKVVGLMNGTYSLYTLLGLPMAGNFSGDNWVCIRPASNTSSFTTPTIIVAQTPQGAIIDGQRDAIQAAAPSLDWGVGLIGPHTFNSGEYGAGITIDGLKFVGANYRCITNYGGAFPSGRGGNGNNGCDNLTVRNCWFADTSFITSQVAGKNSSHFYSEGSYHVYVQNCRFDGGGAPSDGGRFNSCQFYSPTQDTQVTNCTIIAGASNNSWGSPLYWKSGAAPGHLNPVCAYNYLDSSAMTSQGSLQQGCLSFDGCNTASCTFQIYNTVMVAALGNPCIYAGPLGNVSGMAGTWDIHDCTFAGDWSAQGCFYGPWNNLNPTLQNWYRNIIWPATGGEGGQNGEFDLATTSVGGTIDYNIYPASAIKVCIGNTTTTYTSLSSWQAALGFDTHSAQENPQFVASVGAFPADYYKLAAGSPALTFAQDGGAIGAWRGTALVGSGF